MKFSYFAPYYNQHRCLPLHIKFWRRWTAKQKRDTEIILIDDCSTTPLDISLLRGLDLDIKVYRIAEDLFWNVSGVKNLGFKLAKHDWVITADFDNVITSDTLYGLQDLDYSDTKVMYWPYLNFPSEKIPTRLREPHVNSYVMNKQFYWETGGYSEAFTGNHGYEDSFFHQVILPPHNPIKIELPEVWFRWIRDPYVSRSRDKNDNLTNRSGKNEILYKELKESFDPSVERKILNFTWEKAYES
jgi:hypothetical protein